MPTQPRHLTLTEMAAGYALFAGGGYLLAGSPGAWSGAAAMTAIVGWRIWCAASARPTPVNQDLTWPAAAEACLAATKPHEYRLTALPTEWQREMVALLLLDDGVNWGNYLTFFVNNGREAARYAVQALRAIGAPRTAAVVERAQALIDEHAPPDGPPRNLLPNPVLAKDGTVLKPPGSVLPDSVIARLRELSAEYSTYPEEVGALAEAHYAPLIAAASK